MMKALNIGLIDKGLWLFRSQSRLISMTVGVNYKKKALNRNKVPFAINREQFQGNNVLLDPVAMGKLWQEPPEEMPEHPKSLTVNIVGVPNAGKSTLVNQLVGANVCPHSMKIHTTRQNSLGLLTKGDGQVIFLDTPGIITEEEKERFRLSQELYSDPFDSCIDTDLIVVVHDVSNRFVREALGKSVLKLLCMNPDTPSILVLNKMDTIPKSRRVYDLIRKLTCGQLEGREETTRIRKDHKKITSVDEYFKKREKRQAKEEISDKIQIKSYNDLLRILRQDIHPKHQEEVIKDLCKGLVGWPGFKDVFTVCALDGTGVGDLRDYLLYNSKPREWRYNEKVPTVQDPRDLVMNIIKSKFLDVLEHDVPYKIKPLIESWVIENGVLRLVVSVKSHNPRTTNILLSSRTSNLSKVAKLAEKDLQNLFHCEVFLILTVHVTHDTRSKTNAPEDNITFH